MKAVAPWVRTRLRAAPGAALALGVLVLVTAFLAAAFPRAVDTYEGEGLRQGIRAADPDVRGLGLTVAAPGEGSARERSAGLTTERLEGRYRAFAERLPEPLRADMGQSSYGVRAVKPVATTDEWIPRLSDPATVFTAAAPARLTDHATLRSGRLPRTDRATPATRTVEAVVTTATARTLKIKVGSTVHLSRASVHGPLAVRVTGIVEPRQPRADVWAYEPALREPIRRYTQGAPTFPYWHGSLLLPVEAAPVLLSLGPETETYWRLSVDAEGLGTDDLPALRAAVTSVESGPGLSALRAAGEPALEVATGLDDTLVRYEETLDAIAPVVAVAAVGAATVMVVVVLMAGSLALTRRRAELTLLRSRGGSLPGIAGRLLAESAVAVVPAAVAGAALAWVLFPAGRAPAALLATAAVAVVACGTLPVRAVLLHRSARVHGERDDLTRARPSRRRTVAELTVLVLAVAAAFALRRRGTDSGGGVDQLVSAAPVLVGVAGALLIVRLYPLPLRLLALPLARSRGALGFLSLARAGRAPATTTLPLLALLVALMTAAFGGSVLAGVDAARDRAALVAVGADARIETIDDELPKGAVERVRAVAGVRDVVAVRREFDLDLHDGGDAVVTLFAVDAKAYERLARATGQGEIDADALTVDSGPLPALASPAVADRLGGRPVTVGTPDGQFTVRLAGVRTSLPALADNFVVVDAASLKWPLGPTALMVTGEGLSGPALKAAAGGGVSVDLRSAERAGFTDAPVHRGAERIYLAAAATGAGYAVLAVLLSLLRAAPERTALLARLRTMGLTRRQGRWLLVLENLPQTLPAGIGGAVVGWVAITLVAPGVDLAELALTGQGRFDVLGAVRLTPDTGSLLLPAAAVVVVAAGVAALQAWAVTRRTTTTELRVGDTR
ncbi:FtsX-like permease family protein [Streptomyces yaizuensis]|uniref:FtsX-like permease family protein n=1 Tax=Streptomyces yaizuensis TaxID=2989713 RepID=A0ABQ5P8H2_9ACTN|nr:FtsX-like permease family protein [Streptomyces sp. YSPA8]GLF98861.1 FtsX-like permease family protein [Streptomyces sp. YSPA8]